MPMDYTYTHTSVNNEEQKHQQKAASDVSRKRIIRRPGGLGKVQGK